jgi:hypothetical protein
MNQPSLFARLRTRRARAAVGLVAFITAASVAAAGPAAADCGPCAQTIDIAAVDDSYSIHPHGAVHAGLVRLRLFDYGQMDHQAQLFRLNDGVTYQKFVTDLQSPNPNQALFGDAVPTGGTTPVTSHGDQTVYQALQGGTYVVVCFVPGPDGVPHFVKGMYAPFTIAGTATPAQLAAVHPTHVDGVIQAHDMTYTMPAVLHNGGLYRFQDTDAEGIHEVNLAKLLPGKTVADAKAWFASLATPAGPTGPPPFTYSGGFGAELPGNGGWFQADVTPGAYIAFCLVPDEQTGIPHAASGMVVGFTVPAGH